MSALFDALTIAVGGALLWLAGTVVFDTVHWLLHGMLGSRSALLRKLAWPHEVHHRWLDGQLRTEWSYQDQNVACHLIPEFVTQIAFSSVLLLLLPPAPVWVCIALQTLVFGYILSQRGLDINHRPIAILDAYPPSFVCPPAYHALHHVYPDAYFSAYTKLVDAVVGGAGCVLRRSFGLVGARTPLGRALAVELEAAGAAQVRVLDGGDRAAFEHLDVLVLCDASAPAVSWIESFTSATRTRQLPPEVWAVSERADDALARHYARDVRVSHRLLFAPGAERLDAGAARRLARRAIRAVMRGLHFVPLCDAGDAWRAWRRHRATRPEAPPGVELVRSRLAAARAADRDCVTSARRTA